MVWFGFPGWFGLSGVWCNMVFVTFGGRGGLVVLGLWVWLLLVVGW